jgi:hypothetical protein
MRYELALAGLLCSSAALGQAPANPPPGSVWTYTSAGANWVSGLSIAAPFPANTGTTPVAVANLNVGSYPVAGLIPAPTVSGFTSAVSVPITYAEPKWPATAIAGYIENTGTASSGIGGTVAVFGQAQQTRNVPGVPFGANFIVQNCSWAVTGSCYASGGFSANGWEGLEINANILKLPGGVTPTGGLYGLALIGESEVSPTGNGGSSGVLLFPLGWTNHVPWDFGLRTYDGAARLCGVCIGALGQQGPHVFSQGLNFVAYDDSSVRLNAAVQVDPGGFLNFVAPAGLRSAGAGNAATAAFDVFRTSGPWLAGFQSEDGAASTGLALGALGVAGPSVASQGINWRAYNASSAPVVYSEQFGGNGVMLRLAPTGGGNLFTVGPTGSPVTALLFGLAAGAGTTGITGLSVNNNAGVNAAAVTLGIPDSGGSGFRALRVPN